ncbi:MAG: hypothetical protein MRY83_02920, partial [Flavobacteriales bacterium]|nr:hypothetical protein [Flavobacteriales bacterium]
MRKAYYFVFGYFVLLVISYSNHFDNPFFFDDHHTIVQNTYVHSIKNLPLFFYDTKTASTRPDLQGYRPIVQVLNAVDYSLGSGSTKAFHIHIFTHFLILLYLVFYMIKRIFERSSNLKRKTAIYLSLFITGFFGIHASHTETINYIISRSDLFSTLCMLLAFLLYDREKTRRRLLFLIPLIIGYFTKQVVASFAIIIWIYDILFIQTDHSTLKQKVLKGSKYGIITLVVLVSTFIVSEAVFSDIGNVVGPKKHGRLGYLQTQIFIVMHYIGNFFVPIDLSADPDFTIIGKFWDKRIIYSLLGHIFILIVALTCLKRRIYYPIAFGILWFYIALAPTSTLVPLGQISNDHRTMFPFIGLCLSAGYGVFLLYSSLKLKVYKQIVLTCVLTIFLAHGYGIKE